MNFYGSEFKTNEGNNTIQEGNEATGEPDNVYAEIEINNSTNSIEISSFDEPEFSPTNVSIAIEYHTIGEISDDELTLSYKTHNSAGGGGESLTFVPTNTTDNQITLDVTEDRAWTSEQIKNLRIEATTKKNGSIDGATVLIDSIFAILTFDDNDDDDGDDGDDGDDDDDDEDDESTDTDEDGIDDDSDNCPAVSNPDQTDSDGDGIGDACEEDDDDDEDDEDDDDEDDDEGDNEGEEENNDDDNEDSDNEEDEEDEEDNNHSGGGSSGGYYRRPPTDNSSDTEPNLPTTPEIPSLIQPAITPLLITPTPITPLIAALPTTETQILLPETEELIPTISEETGINSADLQASILGGGLGGILSTRNLLIGLLIGLLILALYLYKRRQHSKE
ncbi:MAG TPA: hypothetical protein PK398_02280 [Candidatus Gracilibacteria bacterium]|nr:hypothetical protein [Candidatus Gracilibacteria bacterium]